MPVFGNAGSRNLEEFVGYDEENCTNKKEEGNFQSIRLSESFDGFVVWEYPGENLMFTSQRKDSLLI